MKRFRVRLRGITPLMHHKMTEEAIMSLLGPKAKKKIVSVEKTPRELAEDHAYLHEDGRYYIPLSYVSGAFAQAASDYKQTNSKKSYKAIAGGVFRPASENAFLVDDKDKPIKKFEVDIKKATNHKAGAVAVCRPRFDKWETEFEISINEDLLPWSVAKQILEDSGTRSGIGSFRVSKGGYYGQFAVTKFEQVLEK